MFNFLNNLFPKDINPKSINLFILNAYFCKKRGGYKFNSHYSLFYGLHKNRIGFTHI